MTRILRHLQLASVPPPIAPARLRQEICVFDDAHASVSPEARCAPQRRHSPLCSCAIPFEIVPPPSFSDRSLHGPRTGKPLRRNPPVS
jgi:hypothetical protein